MSDAIVWFRRGLRLADNRALCAALAASERVACVFVLDPALLSHPSSAPVRVRFLFEGLAALDADLRSRGGRLVIRHGDPIDELPRLAHEIGAADVFFSREIEPYGRNRDAQVTARLAAMGVDVHTENDHLLIEPDALSTKAGGIYTVFSPYKRAWLERDPGVPLPAPDRVPDVPALASEPLPSPQAVACLQTPGIRGGEAAALQRLERFLASSAADYETARDRPGQDATSRLSAYLKFGMVSARQVYASVRALRPKLPIERRVAVDTFVSELAWRDFYAQILWHFPHVAERSFQPTYDTLEWENDESRFAAWCAGRTGYPMVDAAMRQLATEGWMHNRARMIVASFLTKDLLCDWRWGEAYFMAHLIDGDQAANNGGWQWAAGTGTDAQPYFRIFNPVRQGETFDPDGAYVRRWVPELERVPRRFVHQPWRLSATEQAAVGCVLGRDTPQRIVDHDERRARALTLYRQAAARAAGDNE